VPLVVQEIGNAPGIARFEDAELVIEFGEYGSEAADEVCVAVVPNRTAPRSK
jgi:hypothetical protein